MQITPLKNELNASIVQISKYQKGELKLIKTNRPWFDGPGGLLPQSIITIFGASFSGKTTELQNITDDIMQVDINPDAKDYVVCTHAFEMSNFSLTLKDIKKITGKTYKEILSQPITGEDQEKLTKYFDTKRDGRYFVNHSTGSAKDIADVTRKFLEENKAKKLCLIELDHIALLKSKANDKKASIDELTEELNDMKLTYPNFMLVLLCQANRSVLSRLGEKTNEMKLQRSDIYQSDAVFHISDYVVGLQNAYYLGIEEYRKINPERYPNLSHRFTSEDTKGKVSLFSEGCIFVEILKDRMADDLDFTDLYTLETKEFVKPEEKTPVQKTMPTFAPSAPPVFDKPDAGMAPSSEF